MMKQDWLNGVIMRRSWCPVSDLGVSRQTRTLWREHRPIARALGTGHSHLLDF